MINFKHSIIRIFSLNKLIPLADPSHPTKPTAMNIDSMFKGVQNETV